MKKYLVCILFILLTVIANCQPDTVLRVRTDRENINIKERYYVLKSDKKIRYGKFLRFGATRSEYYLLEEGRYVNNQKSGTWRFYYDGYPYNQIQSRGSFKNENRDGYWEFFFHSRYYNPLQPDSNKSDLNKQNGSAVYYIKEGAKKSSGNFAEGKKTGIWNYYNTSGDTILILDHSKDSVVKIDYAFLPERDTSGIIRPFFEGGSNYFYLMCQLNIMINLDKAGIITYKLTVNKNTLDNELALIENKTSKATEAAVQKKLSSFREGWIPLINNNVIETADVFLVVTVTRKTSSNVITPNYNPSASFSVSKDFYWFNIEVK